MRQDKEMLGVLIPKKYRADEDEAIAYAIGWIESGFNSYHIGKDDSRWRTLCRSEGLSTYAERLQIAAERKDEDSVYVTPESLKAYAHGLAAGGKHSGIFRRTGNTIRDICSRLCPASSDSLSQAGRDHSVYVQGSNTRTFSAPQDPEVEERMLRIPLKRNTNAVTAMKYIDSHPECVSSILFEQSAD